MDKILERYRQCCYSQANNVVEEGTQVLFENLYLNSNLDMLNDISILKSIFMNPTCMCF